MMAPVIKPAIDPKIGLVERACTETMRTAKWAVVPMAPITEKEMNCLRNFTGSPVMRTIQCT